MVVTEKMDGSNVCLTREGCFARSHTGPPTHPSFDPLKALHATVRSKIPEDFQIFGEWLYAKHSLLYTRLPHHLMIFGARDTRKGKNLWVSWEEVKLWAEELGVPTVPVMGLLGKPSVVSTSEGVESLVTYHAGHHDWKLHEGFVIRWARDFHDSDFSKAVGKWVRPGHVQTDEHWKRGPIVRNRTV